MIRQFVGQTFTVLVAMFLVACEDIPTVSILSETEDFVQAASEVNNKIDILWVVDNSGSMGDSQAALAANFESFIQDIENKGYDFQIAVITTEAYRGGNFARFRSTSGHAILTPNTPNLRQAFISNVMVGTNGSPDEQGARSMEVALAYPDNMAFDFPRRDAFFSVVIVSDENDSSRGSNNQYPGLTHYQALLDSLRMQDSLAGRQNYSVNAIVRLPENRNCTTGTDGLRYIELAQATGGIVADICGDFSASLNDITISIVELSTQFFLSRKPIIESIRVFVNRVEIPQDSQNGWEYIEESNSIRFNGSAIPAQGSSIFVEFDPVSLIN